MSEQANGGVKANGSFTAKIRELEAANLQLNEELGRTRSHLQSSLRESHTLHAQVSDLRHELQAIASQNHYLRGEIAQTQMGHCRGDRDIKYVAHAAKRERC
jgi:regulator of replication initiation timing